MAGKSCGFVLRITTLIWATFFIFIVLVVRYGSIIGLRVFSKEAARKEERGYSFIVSWEDRNQNINISSIMKVPCGSNMTVVVGPGLSELDYVEKCEYVVASSHLIDDGSMSLPDQPMNVSQRSRKLFCFVALVDDRFGTRDQKQHGIWRIVTIESQNYKERVRRNLLFAKILIHKLFPRVKYSIWVDATATLKMDPLLILERYVWRGQRWRGRPTVAAAHSKRHCYVVHEGMELDLKPNCNVAGKGIVMREHKAMSNLFSCLWFQELTFFKQRELLSFRSAAERLASVLDLFLFPNSELHELLDIPYQHYPDPNDPFFRLHKPEWNFR